MESKVLGCAWVSRVRFRATVGTEMEEFGSLGFSQKVYRSSITVVKAFVLMPKYEILRTC